MFEKNMKIIKEKDSALYAKLVDLQFENKYKIIESKNGLPNIELGNNKYLHSKYDPENEAKKWADGINMTDKDSLIIMGLGLGYYLDELIKRFPQKTILVIEPDIDMFYNLITIRDIKQYYNNSKITLIVELEQEIISAIINEHFYFNSIRKPIIIEIPAYNNLYIEEIKELYEGIHRNIIEFRGNIATKLFFANMWIDNGIRNLNNIKMDYSAKIFNNGFEEIPTIIVSAGPSLDKNVKLLKNMYNKALIIAVGSATNILEKNDIKTHMIMGIDGLKEESNIFKSLKSNEAIFLYAPTIHYESPKLYKGRKAWFGLDVQPTINEILNKYYVDYPILNSGPSVANIALSFANKVLKSRMIIFIGQDLAYTNEKIYADGYVNYFQSEEVRDYNNKDFVLTKDIYGKDIYTKKPFLNMQKWFEDYVRIFRMNERVINCTEGGIGIPGVRNLDLEQTIDLYLNKDYNIDRMLGLCFLNNTKICTKSYDDDFVNIESSIKNCNKLSAERIKLLQKLFNDLRQEKTGIKFGKRFDKILDISKKIEKEIGYMIFIEPMLKVYIDFTTFNANKMVNDALNIDKARYESLKVLLNQYLVIDNSIKVALKAFESNENL